MNCKEGTGVMLRQIVGLLDQLPDSVYHQPLALFNGSTIGQHFRHILNFYQCLLRDVPSGVIDYALRDRDLQLERDPHKARSAFVGLAEQVEWFDEQTGVEVLTDFAVDPVAPRARVSSSLGRELMYAYDHALHHLAIVKIGLKQILPEIELEEELGVAPSTLKFQKGNRTSDD